MTEKCELMTVLFFMPSQKPVGCLPGVNLRKGVKIYGKSKKRVQGANVKHFFTLLGKVFFAPLGKEIFTSPGKQFFTWYGKEYFTRYSKQIFTLPVIRWLPCFFSAPLYGSGGQV